MSPLSVSGDGDEDLLDRVNSHRREWKSVRPFGLDLPLVKLAGDPPRSEEGLRKGGHTQPAQSAQLVENERLKPNRLAGRLTVGLQRPPPPPPPIPVLFCA
jgi:hypothetical protein